MNKDKGAGAAADLAALPQEEACETLQAIREGKVDAFVVHQGETPRVYLLKDPDRLHQVIVERMSEGAALVAEDGSILYCNASFAGLVGRDKSALPRQRLQSLVAPEHQRRLASTLANARTAPASAEIDLIGQRGTLPIHLSASPVGLPDWESCMVLVVTDLTARRRSEGLAGSGDFARSVLDQAAEPIVVCDPGGIVTHASVAAQALCRSSPLGRHFAEAFPLRLSGEAAQPTGLGGASQDGVELEMDCADGQRRHFLGREGPLKGADGQVLGHIYILADITDRKQAEMALQEEREARNAILTREVAERTAELRAANSQLEGFIYAASHDLRGSLGRINSFSSLLEKNYRGRLDGDGLLFLHLIRQNAGRLTNLVDDLLNHFRIDHRETRLQPMDLAGAVRDVLREKAEDIRDAGATVLCDLPEATVLADAYGLTQVLRNIVENAIKYSGQVAEPVVEIGGEPDAHGFRLWVRDNGIGFDMKYHDRIFEIFRRLHSYADYPGNGIGLALVKRAMERMGGSVWAESAPGKGATFYLQFRGAVRPVRPDPL